MKSPIQLQIALLRSLKREIKTYEGTERDIRTLRARYRNEGRGFITKTAPSLYTAILDGLETGTFKCPSSFKKQKDGSIPRFLGGLIGTLFDKQTGILLDSADPKILKDLGDFLCMFKKLAPTEEENSSLESEGVEAFRALDDSIKDFQDLGDWPKREALKRVSNMVLWDLEFDPRDFIGKHGPGAVKEGLSPNEKYRALLMGLKSSPLLKEFYLDELFPFAGIPEDLHYSSSSAKLCCVPKTAKSVRTISVEPALNVYVQGGLNTFLRSYIERNKVLRCSLTLRDQSNSQKIAMEASRNRKYCTLDLSNASDLMSNDLVREIFDGTQIGEYLQLARTPLYSVGQNVFLMKKYAGMGNATTFPVMSIVITLICVTAILSQANLRLTTERLVHAARMVRVYGDDIAVPTRYYDVVEQWLTSFGFVLNRRKSFAAGYFRESCGVDAFKGVKVTPQYVKALPDPQGRMCASTVAHLVAQMNQYYDSFRHEVADIIRTLIESKLGPLPLVQRNAGVLGVHTIQNASQFNKWDSKLHRFVIRSWKVKTKKRPDNLDGYGALLKFFHNCTQEERYATRTYVADHLKTTHRRRDTSLSLVTV